MAPLRQAQSTPVSAPAGRAAVAVPEAENQAAAAPVAPALISAAIDERFEALLKRVRANRPNEDTSLIRKAWEFCVGHHAGQLRASLDVRHADDAVRHQAVKTLLDKAEAIAARRGLTVASRMLMDQPAVAMDPAMCTMASEAIRGLGITPLSMVSGAGHDAMIMAERVPATMIFLRSPGGISHHPEESVRPQDVENALAAGLALLRHIWKEQSIPHA